MEKPVINTLSYYDFDEITLWLEIEYGIDVDKFWEWLCEDSMTNVNNDTYGNLNIWGWINCPEETPDFVFKIANILKTDFNAPDNLTVYFSW